MKLILNVDMSVISEKISGLEAVISASEHEKENLQQSLDAVKAEVS